MLTRRRAFAVVSTGSLCVAAGGRPPSAWETADVPGLWAAGLDSSVLYGSAVQASHLTDPSRADLAGALARECGLLVPEGALKWAALRPTQGRFDYGGSDAILRFAARHGQRVRGHALLWHQAMPGWFDAVAEPGNAQGLLASHVEGVCGRYAGRLQAWDVANEVVDAGAPGGLRATPWLRLLGPEYVATAFHLAHAVDPVALLFLNDYGLEPDGPATDAKRLAVLGLLRRLLDADVPVDGLGLQAHLVAGDRFDSLPGFLAQVGALGLRVAITELDVSDERLPGEPVAERDAAVAAAYAAFLRAAFAVPGLVREVLTWGLSDANSWLQSHWPRPDGLQKRPLPLDAELMRKPAWAAIRGALQVAGVR